MFFSKFVFLNHSVFERANLYFLMRMLYEKLLMCVAGILKSAFGLDCSPNQNGTGFVFLISLGIFKCVLLEVSPSVESSA